MNPSNDRPSFVFVHGAWHNGATWTEVVDELARRGHGAIAGDLPGAGRSARNPVSFSRRPLDVDAFATERSPNTITQAERTEAVIDDVRRAAAMGNGKVVLVGHSLGGRTISPVAEAIPNEIGAVVYLTAQFNPPGRRPPRLGRNPMMGSLFAGDPRENKAFRMDVDTTDPATLAVIRDVFYNDLTDEQVATAMERLVHCDEPLGIFTEPTTITPERFGTVERHYIRCLKDQALPAEDQTKFVAVSDAALGTTTIVHDLDRSHSPFYSAPAELVDLLLAIAER